MLVPHLLTFPTPSVASPTLGLFQLFQFGFLALQFFTSFQPHGLVLWSTVYLPTSDMALDYKQPSSKEPFQLGPEEPFKRWTTVPRLFYPSWGKDVSPWHYSPFHVLYRCVILKKNTLTFTSCEVGRVYLQFINLLFSLFSMRSHL